MIQTSKGLRKRSVFDRSNQRTGLMMTPMVDVVLVILIFFMASTTIAGYEWFLQASIESQDEVSTEPDQARFDLPAAIIDVDLVRSSDGITVVYGIKGEQGIAIDQAVDLIESMELGPTDALQVGIGANDLVSMRDLMRIHDAWNGRGVRVIMRTSR
ncbi:MAG: biopolymer transporter ExbD [Phycisphaerales bacterium]